MLGKKRIIGLFVVAAAALCLVAGCAASGQAQSSAASQAAPAQAASVTQTSEGSVASDDAILDDSHWRDLFPNQYYSYRDSVYLEYPVEGTGHAGSLWDVQHVGNWSAGCAACHCSQLPFLLEERGEDLFTVNTVSPGRYERAKITEEMLKDLDEDAFDRFDARRIIDVGIACYQCHGNTPGQMVVANPWTVEAAEKAGIDADNPDLVCAQCHTVPDYTHILTDTDSSTWFMLQYGTDPDDVYDAFLERGVPNPEFSDEGLEFDQFYGSTMDKAGANCADCHMRVAEDESGVSYHDHAFLDPGTHTELYENCSSCHKDTPEERLAAVQEVQADYRQRAEEALGAVDNLEAAIAKAADNGASQQVIDEATALFYRAQFYYNYGRETCEGVHSIGNGTTEKCFGKALATAAEGMKLVS